MHWQILGVGGLGWLMGGLVGETGVGTEHVIIHDRKPLPVYDFKVRERLWRKQVGL